MSRHARLTTEMIHAGALVHGDARRFLAHGQDPGATAIQLGGDKAEDLALASRMAVDAGYDEVNLNVGCPSERVQQGRFGAILMREPHVVADLVAHLRAVVAVPVTVKHRIGVDDFDAVEDLFAFVDIVAAAGCDRFIVHARKAILCGLSPAENRTIPPLRYADVYALAARRPDLAFEINGGIADLPAATPHLNHVDGVMVGRAAWDRPLSFTAVDSDLYGDHHEIPKLADLAEMMGAWGAASGEPHRAARALLNVTTGLPGARAWRQHLTDALRPATGVDGLLVGIRDGLRAVEAASNGRPKGRRTSDDGGHPYPSVP